MRIAQKKIPREEKTKEAAFSNINLRSFLTVVSVLVVVLFLCGALSYVVPRGNFLRDASGQILLGSYREEGVEGIAIWRVLTAPVRVFASSDALLLIMISIFLLVMSGVFNLLEKTGGIKIFIGRIMLRLRDKGGPVVCVTVLILMLFGSFFGMFEELVTLLPIIILFMLSMRLDTMTGLGACLLAACFGFSAAITNPFSVGLASQVADVNPSDGVWLRLVFFAITYVTLCVFLMLHLRKIEKDPTSSPSYEADQKKREVLQLTPEEKNPYNDRVFRIYAGFFAIQGILLVLIASVRAIASLAIPILAISFLVFGALAGILVTRDPKKVAGYILRGGAAMLPAVLMIALAGSVKLVMEESGITDTIMHYIIEHLTGKNPFLAIVLIYGLILFLQVFIGSASAKIILVMPIVMPVATALGLSPSLVILAYCMADGFTDVILPTNPVLLIGLSMANVSYLKWVKWTWKLQAVVLIETFLTLFFGIAIGY
ncbi:MAG: YfcC family protein [Clostridia bacterium]|nr:YfcC family protein [Clostridia bacterium]